MIIQTYLYTAQEPHWTPLIHTATTKELLNEGLLIEKIKDEEIGKMIADIGFTINNSFISMTDIDIWEANDIKSKWSHIVQLCNWKSTR